MPYFRQSRSGGVSPRDSVNLRDVMRRATAAAARSLAEEGRDMAAESSAGLPISALSWPSDPLAPFDSSARAGQFRGAARGGPRCGSGVCKACFQLVMRRCVFSFGSCSRHIGNTTQTQGPLRRNVS